MNTATIVFNPGAMQLIGLVFGFCAVCLSMTLLARMAFKLVKGLL